MNIYVPGRGTVNLRKSAIDRDLHAYDEHLFLSKHPDNQQWTVFVKIERDLGENVGVHVDGVKAYPIFGYPLGTDESTLTADKVMAKVYATDTLRHGEKMLDEIHRHNDRIKKAKNDKASDAAGYVAEVVESFQQGHGGDLKFGRVYMNGNNGRNTAIRTG